MAGPLSQSAREKSLANDFGPTHGANSPTQFLLALYTGHPEFGGVELNSTDCPGYARPTINNTAFALVDGRFEVEVTPANATGAWTQVADYAVLLNATTPTEAWDYAPIQRVQVNAAGPLTPIVFTVFYSDDATTP